MSFPLSVATIAAVCFGIAIMWLLITVAKQLCRSSHIDRIENTHRAQEAARMSNATFADELSKQLANFSKTWPKL